MVNLKKYRNFLCSVLKFSILKHFYKVSQNFSFERILKNFQISAFGGL